MPTTLDSMQHQLQSEKGKILQAPVLRLQGLTHTALLANLALCLTQEHIWMSVVELETETNLLTLQN